MVTQAGIAEFNKLELHLEFFTHVLHLPMLQLSVMVCLVLVNLTKQNLSLKS